MILDDWQSKYERYLQDHFTDEDGAHDIAHFRRVWGTAQRIMDDQAEPLIILTACYFHDIVSLPKNHPERHLSSRLAAKRTPALLASEFPEFPVALYPGVAHAIEAHSFSAGIAPQSHEAKIVQDADRLEALGAIGLARVFYVSGQLANPLFDADDPFATHRKLDDRRWALDHFQSKLLKLPETMQTEKGRALARHNANFLVTFMAKLSSELRGDHLALDEEVLRRFSL
ncbi:phosphohydrolase [Atlantibacter hermannii]|uniref:phosphohydrolase n=2 Tax=Atlantibacter hermannii TaxID=565 RepID=UPI000EC34C43|nr:phosphohydrolase [Atlantibacter hermannii]HAP82076.1 phosphohydrolase [Enterobacteriaceae bacterium]